MAAKTFIIATADCETDPFEYQLVPKPFVWGFYSEAEGYCHFWGEGETREEQEQSATEQFIDFLIRLPDPHMIYVRNGGRFDFYFLMGIWEGKFNIVNNRIIECRFDQHVFRDSYAIVPIPLAAYKKDEFDYTKMAFDKRQRNRSEIIHYLGNDCRYDHEIVTGFRAEFGNVLTIGSAAMRALKSDHSFETFTPQQDAQFRQFYYGGRNQCFASGILAGKWQVYDVNSMYPACMRDMLHPISAAYTESTSLTDNTDFAIVEGRNFGGLPYRHETGFLDFAHPSGTYYVTGHELRAALDTGTFELQRIVTAYEFAVRISFDEFVNRWYGKRLVAKASDELLLVIFYKLILNSAYGKFCTDPSDYRDWEITEAEDYLDMDYWTLEFETMGYRLWSKPAERTSFYNVATGASITGAARSVLLHGLSLATNPVYCDTDSIICESFTGPVDNDTLGAWKLEAEGDEICIAGKKLYALYNGGKVWTDKNGKPKQASKGSKLTADDIRRVASGAVVRYENPVPAFKLDGDHMFIARNIRSTVLNPKPFGV